MDSKQEKASIREWGDRVKTIVAALERGASQLKKRASWWSQLGSGSSEVKKFPLLAMCSAGGVGWGASGRDLRGVGGDPCALVVGNSAGGDARDKLGGDTPRMKVCYDEDVAGDHRAKSKSRALSFVAKGNPVCEAKHIPTARPAPDSEREQLWDMR